MTPRILALALVLPLLAVGIAAGEIVTLRDGTPIQGEVLEGTEEGFRFRLIDGGELFVPWDRIIQRDYDRLQRRLGFVIEEETTVFVPGVALTLTDGTSYRGVLLDPRQEGMLHLKQSTGPIEIPTARVTSMEEIEIDALEAYTPRQLYQLHVADRVPATADEHFDLTQYCRRIGDFEKAREHLEAIVDIDPEYNPEAVRLQTDAVLTILDQKEARRLFDELRTAARRSQYDKALAALDRLEGEYPESPILGEMEKHRVTREILTTRQRGLWRARAVQRGYYWIRELATRKVREDELTVAEVKGFAEGELGDAVTETVAEKEGLAPELVKELWEERDSRARRRATYGSGTFLVEKSRKKETPQSGTGSTNRRDGRRRTGGQRQTAAKQQKPPSPDQWWLRAGPTERRGWLIAYFAEHSPGIRVLRIEYVPCLRCAGRGTISVLNMDGGPGKLLCERCWGRTRDRMVVFQ